MAFVIAPIPAGARSAPQANNTNGMAELMTPIAANRQITRGAKLLRERQRNGSSTRAPSERGTSTSANGPKSPAAMRINRNEAPQIAPSNVSSIGVTQPDPIFDCSAVPLIRKDWSYRVMAESHE